MPKCLCAIVNDAGKVEVERTGWVKVLVGEGKPLPDRFLDDGQPVRWTGGKQGYQLVYCPECATREGKKKAAAREAA